ncbi:glycosyltransferase family 39 protein [Candidatus Woesearchaeota archaeon]|nr:glycosyltransferase family 39 protein [Candidatus Woesearchaeota archaeon]
MNRNLAFLLVIVLLGTALRFYDIGAESLWTDEMLSVDHARQPSVGEVIEHVRAKEAAPPLHYVFLHYWVMAFGDSDVSVRVPSVIFSIASIILLYVIVKLFFSERTALIAAFLFTISMQQVLYAQEARLYSMFMFIALLATYGFIRAFVMSSPSHHVMYFIALTMVLYTNYLTIVLVVFYGLVLFWKNKEKKKWSLYTSLALLLSVPLVPFAFQQFVRANSGLEEVLLGFGMPQFIASLGLFVFALPSIAACALLILVIALKKQIKNVRLPSRFFVALVAFLCAVYAYLSVYPLSLFMIPLIRVPITNSYFLIRHSLFLAPLLYGYIAWKTDTLRKNYVILVLVMIVVTQMFALGVYYTTATKPDWKGAMASIGDGALVLLDRGGGSNHMLLQRYKTDANVVSLTQYSSRSDFYQIPDATVIEIVEHAPEFWLLLSKAQGTGNYYQKMLDVPFERKETEEFYGVKVFEYDNLKYPITS